MIPDDLKHWAQESETRYASHESWWMSWYVEQSGDGLWYWSQVDHDGWDSKNQTERDDWVAAGEGGYGSWEEAARAARPVDD